MEKLKSEWTYFWTAVMFFTRIPIPFNLTFNDENMNQSQKYYAWVGLIVGGVYALVYFLSQFVFGDMVALILAFISGVLLTGAFHEDGFGDICDGFGGGYGKDRILAIMKDSRIGAYGTLGMVLLAILKLAALLQLANLSNSTIVVFVLIFAHSASRFMAATTIYTHRYVRDTDTSKIKPIAAKALPLSSFLIGLIALFIPFVFFQNWSFLWVLIPAYISKIYLAAYFKKHIGGYTGDCLGAIQQVSEVVIYLSAIAVWKYI